MTSEIVKLLRSAFTVLAITQNLPRCNGVGDNEIGTVYTCCETQNSLEQHGTCRSKCRPEMRYSYEDGFEVPTVLSSNNTSFRLKLESRNASVFDACPTRYWITKHIPSRPPPKFRTLPTEVTESDLVFYQTGSMKYNGSLYSPVQYCLDRLPRGLDDIELEIAILDETCAVSITDTHKRLNGHLYSEKWINHLFAVLSGLSCLFSILNVIIYLSLRKYLNVSGWVEFSYFLALGVFSAFSVAAFLHHPTGRSNFSYVTSVILQFAEIMMNSSFLMIAFDAYWMLRKSDNFGTYGEEVEESKLRLVIYYIFLLAVPIGTTTYGIISNQGSIPSDYSISGIPQYGDGSCFAPSWPVSEYLSFCLSTLTLLVILLTVNHIFKMLSVSAEVDDAPRVSLLSNLFFFTLFYWIMDLLKFSRPFLLDGKEFRENSGSQPVWIVMNAFTYAQGIMSFGVFIFNRKTLKAFRKKSGSDGTLREIFRHACCGTSNRMSHGEEDVAPMSPLMKSSSMRRSTVRQNHLY